MLLIAINPKFSNFFQEIGYWHLSKKPYSCHLNSRCATEL